MLTAVGLTPGGSSSVHIYTQTIHRTTQLTTRRTTNWEECGPCPVFTSYTLAFALQQRKKHGETSVRDIGGDDPDDSPAVNKTKCLLRRSLFVLAFLYKFFVEVSVCLYFGRKLPGTTLSVLTFGLWENASRLNVFSANFASLGT